MDAHPVPQNITSFQFKLVGDMTLKQFGYLASGLTIAYLLFVFVFPLNPLLAVPFIGLSSLLGAAFAFIPIADRPLDHWLKAYLRAVYSPTKRAWQNKELKTNPSNPVFSNRLQIYLNKIEPRLPSASSLPTTPKPSPSLNLTRIKIAPQSTAPKNKITELVELAREAQMMQTKMAEVNHQIAQAPPMQKPAEIEHLKQYHQSLDILSNQLERISKQINEENKGLQPNKAPFMEKRVVIEPVIKKVSVTPTLTSYPNVINGIVTDPEGNYADGVIVIIHNKDGLPVRALKTNKLGQFTGATPLPPGEYQISLEKDGLEFSAISVTLNNEVMPALQIMARKGGIS